MPLHRFADARVVIIDDTPANVMLIKTLLRRNGLSQVHTLTDARAAEQVITNINPDLVLLDLHMPHRDGFAILADLVRRASGNYLPVLVLTADTTTESAHRALEMGAKDYLTKPFDNTEVLLRVRNLLETRYLHRETRHLDQVNGELLELDRMKTEFVASVSHELRTPLTSIRGYAEILLDGMQGDGNHPQARMLGVIDRNARRLLNLVEDLLLLSQVDSTTLPQETERVDLVELVESACAVLEPAAAEGGLSLAVDADAALTVEGDRAQLERVLLNLLSNAVKFSHPGGAVIVRGRTDGDHAVVSVEDTGIGVSGEELPKLFTRFFRSASDEAHSIPGSGLGLAVVREIVEYHRGSVTMDSVLGKGSTVTIRLPLA